LAEHRPAGDDGKLTGVGCVLTLLTVAVIFSVAIPIVQWRDAETGRPLPRAVAIFAPFLIGAVFNAIGIGLLRLLGLRILSKPEQDDSDSPEGRS
jgi:hypothetical protein